MSESTKRVTHEVVVHKANLALASGESVTDFTQALGDAARQYVIAQMRLDTKVDYCYVVEVYTATVILSCYVVSKDESKRGKYIYTSVSYERDGDTGVFTFTTPTEVQRVTTYKPKPLLKTVKSATGAAVECEVFEAQKGAPGWQPSSDVLKSLWSGVL